MRLTNGICINIYLATTIRYMHYKSIFAHTLNKFHTPTPPLQISSRCRHPIPVSIKALTGDTPHARDHHD